MKKPDRLWWNIFITEYLQNGQNATQAFIKARPGTKPATAASLAERLLRKVEFRLVLDKAQENARNAIQMTHEDWLKGLRAIIESKVEMNAAAKMKAYELLGKAMGWVKEKVEILPDDDLRKLINDRRRRVFGDDADKD